MRTFFVTNSITVTIIVVNIILRELIIVLVTWVGYNTMSHQMTRITNGVFIALFFNTGILLVLSEANLSDVSDIASVIFDDTFYDYSPQWYATIGKTLVTTMLINAFMPPIFELI